MWNRCPLDGNEEFGWRGHTTFSQRDSRSCKRAPLHIVGGNVQVKFWTLVKKFLINNDFYFFSASNMTNLCNDIFSDFNCRATLGMSFMNDLGKSFQDSLNVLLNSDNRILVPLDNDSDQRPGNDFSPS